jgi:hypothetical protein
MRQYVVGKYGDSVIKHGKVVKVYRNESRAPRPLQVQTVSTVWCAGISSVIMRGIDRPAGEHKVQNLWNASH